MADGVLVDTMTFSYLRGLGLYEILDCLGKKSGKLFVTAAVVKQLYAAGSGVGSQVDGMVKQGKLTKVTPVVGDDVSRAVKATLQKKNDAKLVRRDRTDVELVEVAREMNLILLTRENGIHALAARRGVTSIDLATFIAWAINAECLTQADADKRLEKWTTISAAGTGAPDDFATNLVATLAKRSHHAALFHELTELLEPSPTPAGEDE